MLESDLGFFWIEVWINEKQQSMILGFEDLNPDCSSPGFQEVQIWASDFRKFSFREWLFKELQEP